MTTVYLDELKPGLSASLEHTITERDIQLFGEATGDMNPVHFDKEFARKTVFRGRVAHGALSIGFISALLGTKLPGAGSIFLSASSRALVRKGVKRKQSGEGRKNSCGCGSKVSTASGLLRASAWTLASAIRARWPRCTPSKLPIATTAPRRAAGTSSK